MNKILPIIILCIICAAPVFSEVPFAAKVNGEIVAVDQLNKLFDSAKKQLSEHEQIDPSSEEGATLLAATRRSILDELIDVILLEQGAEKFGVTVSAQEVEDRIKKVQKEFPSKSVFSQALSEDNITAEDLHQGIRQEIMIEKIADKLGGSIGVKDSEIDAFFNKNKELFSQPKRIQLFQILVASEKDALDICEKIKKGAAFKDMAKRYSLDQLTKAEGGEIGFIEEAQLPAYAQGIAQDLKAGYVSAPLKADEGFYIISCGEVLDKKENDATGSREQIRGFLVQEKKRAVYERWFEHLKNKAVIEINEDLFLKDKAPKPAEKKLEKEPEKEPVMPKTSGDDKQNVRPPLG